MLHLVRANHDITGSAATAGVLATVNVPSPFWAIWSATVTYQLGNHTVHGWAR